MRSFVEFDASHHLKSFEINARRVGMDSLELVASHNLNRLKSLTEHDHKRNP